MNARLLAVALLLNGSSAHAQTTFELGGGRAIAQPQPDGIWYQKAFPHKLILQTPAIELGMRTELSEHWALQSRVMWLGRNSSNAQAVGDDDYAPKSPNGCRAACPPTINFRGHGDSYGVAAALEWHTTGAWQWGVAIGPAYTRESWTMHIPAWSATGYGPTQDVHLAASRWALRWTPALRLTHGDWYGSLTYYRDGANIDYNGGYYPPVWCTHIALMIGHSF